MPIKTTIRFHSTIVKMAKVSNKTDTSHWQGHEIGETLLSGWREYKHVQSLWKTI